MIHTTIKLSRSINTIYLLMSSNQIPCSSNGLFVLFLAV